MDSFIDVKCNTAVLLYPYFHLISLHFASTSRVALWWVNYSTNYNRLFMLFVCLFFLLIAID